MAYSESDTRSKLIDPKIKGSDWLESNIVREYYFTDGRKLIGGKRGKRYFVDYLLTYKNTNLAIIEAKAESNRIENYLELFIGVLGKFYNNMVEK
jgi:type I restriction enzyme R subunit